MSIARFAPFAAGGALVVGLLGLSSGSPSVATAAVRPIDRTVVAPAPDLQQVAVRYVASGPGNKARYRVRERLMGKQLDNDAVGETSSITGSIALDALGGVIRTGSGFSVEMAGLKSDQSRRDNYVRNRLLATDSFPTTRFAITSVRGLPSPLPAAGKVQFQLLGDLTVKGVTRPTTWNVAAEINGDRLSGTAATLFTFEQFRLTQPKVRIVLSLNDTIRLEYDFAMQKQKP